MQLAEQKVNIIYFYFCLNNQKYFMWDKIYKLQTQTIRRFMLFKLKKENLIG